MRGCDKPPQTTPSLCGTTTMDNDKDRTDKTTEADRGDPSYNLLAVVSWRRRTPRCSNYNLEFLQPQRSLLWFAVAPSRGNQEESYQRQRCGRRRWMNINPAALLSKKKKAAIGRAAMYRSIKKLGRPCERGCVFPLRCLRTTGNQ
jgi:hypothetical protein